MGWGLTKSKLLLRKMRTYSKAAAAKGTIDNSGTAPGNLPRGHSTFQREALLEMKALAPLPVYLLECKMTKKSFM